MYFYPMNKSIIPTLQMTFGDRAISKVEIKSFEQVHQCEVAHEALGLGELEDRIVDVLEQGKSIPWGRVAIAMWIFFLFIVVYTVLETISK